MLNNSTANNGTSSSYPFSNEVPELLQKHLNHLKASAISVDVIRERGYRSVPLGAGGMLRSLVKSGEKSSN